MELSFQFRNQAQRDFYYSTARNQCISGGFNNGKTFVGCLKILTLLLEFSNSRAVIARNTYSDLKKTTMQTFFSLCPSNMIESHNEQDGKTVLKNGSVIHWLHLDKVDENTLRGLEANFILVDQAEEVEEKVIDVLDARLGRWAFGIVPQNLLDLNKEWPRDPFTNKPLLPSYHMLLTNPDNEWHWIYRKFHPLSLERKERYFYCEGAWDPTLGSYESYQNALEHDPEWVDKYVYGKWGRSSASIHYLPASGILEPTDELLELIKAKGNLSRVMDHGDSAPTCCLWFAALNGVYICYREYYVPNQVISVHRQSISDLSEGETYSSNYADPQIFKKTAQKDGGFWSVSDEYLTNDLVNSKGEKIPSLAWIAADNNEFATRNRINELLRPNLLRRHPITKDSPAIGLYFIKATNEYPYGCKQAISELGSQRKELIGTIDGKSMYSDERDKNVVDHAYDPIRYFVAMHSSQPLKEQKRPPKRSFAYYNAVFDIIKHRRNVAEPQSLELQ